MPKKGLAYNPIPKRCPAPADLARFPEIQGLVKKEHSKRMADAKSGRSADLRGAARAMWKGRKKRGKDK